MEFTIEKLNGRYVGFPYFTYRIRFNKILIQRNWPIKENDIVKFQDVRVWCWETFGPGIEILHYKKFGDAHKWAWKLDAYEGNYIYLTDETLPFFKLKWE